MDEGQLGLRVAIVGPCASGKSTLAAGLRQHGFLARQIAQEHSYVPAMWQRLSRPDALIYLDASYETCSRRKRLDWLPSEHAEQLHRLRHAREYCDIYVNTDSLTPEQVLARALEALGGFRPTEGRGS